MLGGGEAGAALDEPGFRCALAGATGVIHVTSVGRGEDGRLHVIAIGEGSPRSSSDRFLLGLARARADAILTTGAILRAEPSLRCTMGGSPEETRALWAWRRERLAKHDPPLRVVLTRGADFPPKHPFLRPPGPVLVLTGATSSLALRALRSRRFAVEKRAHPSLRDAIAYLRHERGLATIDVEVGPSTAAGLYGSPPLVDELLLSIFEERILAPQLRAGPFLDPARLEALLEPCGAATPHQERSGRWTFQRYLRTVTH